MSDTAIHLCGIKPGPDMTKVKPPKDDKCPDCGGELYMGYGLMGGGIGVYWLCDVDNDCEYFYKKPESDE